jgi:plastocyanin
MGILLLIAPALLGMLEIPAVRYNFWALGAITILYTLFTDSKLAYRRLIPFTFHRLLDLISGYWLMTVPNIFNYKFELSGVQYFAHILLGLLWVVAAIFTRKTEEPAVTGATPSGQTPTQATRDLSPAWAIATVAASVAIAFWVILVGNRQPAPGQSSLAGSPNTWQRGPGYIPPAEQLHKQSRSGVDPASASRVFEVKSDPTFPAFYPEKLTVRTGETACIRFKNESVQNHDDNLIIVKPGAEREVGIEGVAVGEAGGFIPDLPDKIIANTETVPPGGTDTVCFRAPQKPGRYPYISTARNRWMAMRGVLVVEGPVS